MSDTKLVWIDLETGGLAGRLENGQLGMHYYPIFEIAVIITDINLNQIGDPLAISIFQPESEIRKSNDFALKMHTESGLIDRVGRSKISLADAENAIIDYLKTNGVVAFSRENGTGSYMAGNSILLDRCFITCQMPKLDTFLHYRQIDVTSLTLSFKSQGIEVPLPVKQCRHEALSDIKESIEEFRTLSKALKTIDLEKIAS
ncbi:oligoribonuclease [Photobacterium leiognathi]|uniref:oligoribonuclease n=1 Tax=Photobacterium leiognathi TaxID=553611 RepID=UPI001EDFDD1B|nr:oligoribonuclease [Photobacterium leiognathi]MCG3884438.1 oligoribonuclease [Photobacterium leiognathi]